ncbi:MAG: polysaccharide biosynthesis C-terminal domain-containing protein [Chloroflexia bacterium]
MDETPNRSLSRQVASAMFWNVAIFPLKFLVGIAVGIVVPNLLGLERYALYVLLVSVASTLGSYADLGMERALPRYIPEVAHLFGRAGLRRFLREVIGVKLALLMLILLGFQLFSGPLQGYVRTNEMRKVAALDVQLQQTADPTERERLFAERAAHERLIARLDAEGRLYAWTIGAMLVLGSVFDVLTRLLVAYFQQRATNAIDVGLAFLQPLLIIVLVLLGWDMKGILVALVVTPVVGVILAVSRARREIATLPEGGGTTDRWWHRVWRRFLVFSAISYLINLSTWIYDLAFLSLVTASYLSTSDVAALGVASKFVGLFLTYLMVPLSGIQVPLFAHLYARKGLSELQQAFDILSQFLVLLLVPTGVGLALLSPSLVPLLYPGFPASTSTLVVILIAGMFLETLIGTPQNILQVYERYGIVVLGRLAALVVVPLLYLWVPRYGLLGAVGAASVARVASRAVTFGYSLRAFPLQFPWRFTARVAGATAAMAALVYPLSLWLGVSGGASRWGGRLVLLGKDLGLAVLGALVFFGVLRLLGGLDPALRKRLSELRFPLKRWILRLL